MTLQFLKYPFTNNKGGMRTIVSQFKGGDRRKENLGLKCASSRTMSAEERDVLNAKKTEEGR